MDHRNMDHGAHDREPPPFWRSRTGIALLVFGAVAAFFYFSEHRAHLLGALPLLLVLSCPLMHLFMHGGHGHGHHHEPTGDDGADATRKTTGDPHD